MLEGGSGHDRLEGGEGNDILDGSTGSDRLFGDGGADTLLGGKGVDFLHGGEGVDQFIFRTGDGMDTILDFASGEDTVIFKASNESAPNVKFLSFADLTIVDNAEAGGAVITSEKYEGEIILKGVTASSLTTPYSERVGFEPTKGYQPLPVFKTGAFNRSATSPFGVIATLSARQVLTHRYPVHCDLPPCRSPLRGQLRYATLSKFAPGEFVNRSAAPLRSE